MKKNLQTFILPVICGLTVTLSGCDSKTNSDYEPGYSSNTDFISDVDSNSDTDACSDFDAELQFVPVIEIRKNLSKTAEELKTREFDNLDFSSTEFSFPEIDSITELSAEPYLSKDLHEIYDFFGATIDTLMPGKFTEEQKRSEIRFYDVEDKPEDVPVESYPTIDDYKLTDYAWPYIETDECFADSRFGTLRWYDNGDLKRWVGEEGSPTMDTMGGYGKQVAFITDMNCTDKYALTNGEISIKDAADFVNNFLATTNLSIHETLAKSKAYAVCVIDFGDGKYGYNFMISPEYKNVMFDHYQMEGGFGVNTVGNDYESKYSGSMPGQVGMIETDKIYQLIDPVYMHILNEKETHTSIISLENAAEIVSGFYSGSMDFFVKTVEAVYVPIDTIVTCWKFVMNANDETYSTFVNMRTGEIYVYIQE